MLRYSYHIAIFLTLVPDIPSKFNTYCEILWRTCFYQFMAWQWSMNIIYIYKIILTTRWCTVTRHKRWVLSWWRHQMETFSALLAFVRGIHRSPVNSPHKSQWRGGLMFPLIRIHDCANIREADDSRRQRAHYDVTEMLNIRLLLFYN